MLKIIENNQNFQIYYNDFLIINHTPTLPCIQIGKGDGIYIDHKGVFEIKETIQQESALNSFKILEANIQKIQIEFFDESQKFDLTISTIEEHIELTLNNIDPSFNRFKIRINASESEHIFGCGEQYSEFNLRGKKVPLWSEEQGIGRGDPKVVTWLMNTFSGVGGSWYTTYSPQPTFVSSAKYYCHIEMSAYAQFDFSNMNYHELYCWEMPQKIIIGKFDSMLETVSHLSNILGRQPKLPDWAFDGMWVAIQGKGGKTKVRERLQKALDAGVKVSAIWSQDWEGIKVTSFGTQLFWDWKWNGGGREIRFPEFPQFVKEMNSQGIKYLGYINSFLNIDGDLYKEASEKGYLVKNKSGEEYFITVTTFPAGLIDLTNPEAFEWIKSVMKKYMIEEAGLSGWMSDFGEYLPPDAVLFSGESAETFHNKYPVEWQRANYEAIKEAGKLGEIIFFTRSGYSHTSKYSTLVWAGDQLVNFSMTDGLASVIPAALSLGICAIGYHHSDIGGYTTFKKGIPIFVRSKETFMRWAEQAAFTMVMRSHEGNQPENNWQFDSDEETIDHLARMTQIHAKLKPYFQVISEEYIDQGIPTIRPLFLHYEDDPTSYNLKYEYLLGKDLLIAPVIKKNTSTVKMYLPEDNWVHIWTGKHYSRGWHEISAPFGNPPVFYRDNSEFNQLFNSFQE